MRPAGWRFFSSPAFPRTRVLFFLALSKMRSSRVDWAKTKTISVIPRTSNKSLKGFLKPLSKQFVKIADRLISLLSTNPSDLTIVKPLQNDFATDILKKSSLIKMLLQIFCQDDWLTTPARYPAQKKFLITLIKIAANAITTAIKEMNKLM